MYHIVQKTVELRQEANYTLCAQDKTAACREIINYQK